VSDAPAAELVEQLRHANALLRELLAARDAEIEALRHVRDVENVELRAAVRALTLRVAELERRLGSGSDDSGTPTSKESIANSVTPCGATIGVKATRPKRHP
jgi:hypothetical protein